MADMLCIQATTLDELIGAIEASGRITVRIRKKPQDAEEYIIPESTLVKIANEIRAIEGTTAKIPGAELASRILALDETIEPTIIQLATPIIALYDENGKIEPEYSTSAVLGEAILGYAILGDTGDGKTRKKLDTPVIYLYDDAEEDPVIEQLATPVIYLEEVTDDSGEEEQPTVKQLATPIIELVVVEDSGDDEPEVTIIQLAPPIIYLDIVEEEPDEPVEPVEVATIGYGNYGRFSFDEIIPSTTVKYSALIPIAALVNGSDGWCVFMEAPADGNFAEEKGAFYDADGNYVGPYSYEEKEGTAEEIKRFAPSTATHVRFFLNTEGNISAGKDVIYVDASYLPFTDKLATPIIGMAVA